MLNRPTDRMATITWSCGVTDEVPDTDELRWADVADLTRMVRPAHLRHHGRLAKAAATDEDYKEHLEFASLQTCSLERPRVSSGPDWDQCRPPETSSLAEEQDAQYDSYEKPDRLRSRRHTRRPRSPPPEATSFTPSPQQYEFGGYDHNRRARDRDSYLPSTRDRYHQPARTADNPDRPVYGQRTEVWDAKIATGPPTTSQWSDPRPVAQGYYCAAESEPRRQHHSSRRDRHHRR